LLSRPAWEISIRLAIKDITIVVSLNLDHPHTVWATRGDGPNSTTISRKVVSSPADTVNAVFSNRSMSLEKSLDGGGGSSFQV